MTQDSSLAAASLNPGGRGVLVSHHRPPGRNLSDTTSDRGLDKAPLDKISGVSKPLSQQFPDPLLSSGECWVGGEMHSAPPPDNGACTCRFLSGYGLSWFRSARGTRRDFPNKAEFVRLHRLWRRPPGRFGSSTGRWHSPSRQCIQQDRIRGIRYAPEVEVFLFLELVQTGRIGDPSRLSQPTPALSPRQETILRRMIQICNCLRAAPWSS